MTKELSWLIFLITRSRNISNWILAIIFLPGTIIHEFSHAIMAKLLFVRVGHMELIPQLHGESLKLGSVEVGKTDLVRNFLIGIAPFLVGFTILMSVLYLSFAYQIFGINLVSLLILFIVFIITNTMFSSKKDMEGAIELVILIAIFSIALYFVGFRIPGLTFESINSDPLAEYFKRASILLGFPIILNFAVIVFGMIVKKS